MNPSMSCRRAWSRRAPRWFVAFSLAGLAVGCAASRGGALADPPGAARFDSATWDDGMAVVSVFRGRVKRYGVWRAAEARDYLVREYLDPSELTKRDTVTPELVPVLKANRLVEFETGSYGYRLMSSLSFRRADGALVRARGACLNACGLVSHAWDVVSGRVESDSYWENEGRNGAALPVADDRRFADELPFVASSLAHGTVVRVVAPLVSPRSIVRPANEASADTGLGLGDICEECLAPGSGARASRGSTFGAALGYVRAQRLTVAREEHAGGGATVRFVDGAGSAAAEYTYDAAGHLQGWTIRGEQEFELVRAFRGPYWELVAEDDRARVRAR
jgi:YD repeat-containing protein